MNGAAGYTQLAADPSEVFPDFHQRQTLAALEVYEFLLPHLRRGSITTIVDLGCGSGEILRTIAARLNEVGEIEERLRSVRLVGLDSEEAQIDQARNRGVDCVDGQVCPEFVLCAPERLPFEYLRAAAFPDETSWRDAVSKMAVLCLGHTIFHLPYLPSLFTHLADTPQDRPQLWLVDVYHSWDKALVDVAFGEVREPRSFGKDADGNPTLNVLFTRKTDPPSESVDRGLLCIPVGTIGKAVDSIQTTQCAWPSEKLIGAFTQVQYLPIHRSTGPSGYGEMIRFGFATPNRTFPLPALFLDSKATPILSEVTSTDPTQVSPIHLIAQWIARSGMIKPAGGGGFDFVLIEVAPWYHAHEGLRALSQEVLFCARTDRFDKGQATRMLEAYLHALPLVPQKGLGAYLHPGFAGYAFDRDWADVHFSVLDSARAADSAVRAEDQERYCRWTDELAKATPPELGPRSLQTLDLPEHISGWLETTLIKQFLLGDDITVHRNRLGEDYPEECRLQSSGLPERETLRRDLELVHTLLHERLRDAFELDTVKESAPKSVLLGIPLRSSLDQRRDAVSGLPERYRGGIWIFAAVNRDYGAMENAQLGDLARLAVLLESSAIDAKAAEAFSAIIAESTRQLLSQPRYRKAGEAWRRGEKAVEKLNPFPPGPFHTPELWLSHNFDTLPYRMKRKHDAIIRSASRTLSQCIGEKRELDFRKSITLMKSLQHGSSYIPGMIILDLLSCFPANQQACEVVSSIREDDFRSLACSPGVSGGQLARAVHQLCTSEPDGGRMIRKVLEPPVAGSTPVYHLAFHSEFDNPTLRDRAHDLLFTDPAVRMARDRRPDPGSAVDACYSLRVGSRVGRDPLAPGHFKADKEQAKITPIGERELSIEFWFPCRA